MRHQAQKTVGFLLFLVLLFPLQAFAGRKHEDVEDIGNRKINGKVAFFFPNFVSLEKEIQMGAEYAQVMEQTLRLVEDPVVTEYIDGLAPGDRKALGCQGPLCRQSR